MPVPTLLACGPGGSAPEDGAPQQVAHPTSVALSARNDRSGLHAGLLIRSGAALTVTAEEEELVDAGRRLGAAGFSIEPASALALAGLEKARATGQVAASSVAAGIITLSGFNWTRDLDAVFGERVVHRSVETVMEALGEA